MSYINYVIKEGSKIYVKPTIGHIPINTIGIVSDNVDPKDWAFLKAIESSPGEWDISVDINAKATALAEKSKADDLAQAYQEMSDEVDAKMYEVFRTLKPEYASAEYETWQDMVKRPSAYAGLGLKIDHQLNLANGTELFPPGSALDTAQKITDYATRKIALAEDYGTYRVQRIQQFKNERDQIQNS